MRRTSSYMYVQNSRWRYQRAQAPFSYPFLPHCHLFGHLQLIPLSRGCSAQLSHTLACQDLSPILMAAACPLVLTFFFSCILLLQTICCSGVFVELSYDSTQVDYRRIGNMGQEHLVNATSTSFLHQLRDLWKSPRGTVLRIEALALVAISLSFFLAVFGSCRRWSNHFLIQKGFLAANALFLSLGTYSIGLMQSSPVKSEMYPIWAVSLLALLCCVDSAAASGPDNKSQIWTMLYQLCLYFGYVLLMSITTISSDIGNIAICVLAALTFIKGFHRSMALVLPSSMRNMIKEISAYRIRKCSFGDLDEIKDLIVDEKLDVMDIGYRSEVVMGDIASIWREEGNNTMLESDLRTCKDVCLSLSLSHLLHRRFIGLSSIEQIIMTSTKPLVKNYMRAFKVVEIELAFMYDVLYTSNAFLHYYEARGASIWAFASVIGICFVGAVAIIPGARTTTTRRASPAGIIFVGTTTADFVITGVILVSLALLQVLQLLRCWTSNWARVAFACDYARYYGRRSRGSNNEEEEVVLSLSWGMRLRASLVKMNWFDDKHRLWQNKVGQHSAIDESIRVPGCLSRRCLFSLICSCNEDAPTICQFLGCICIFCYLPLDSLFWKCFHLLRLQYISRELQEMLRGCGTGGPVHLHPDVKASLGDFVGNKIRSAEVSDWAISGVENRQSGQLPGFSVKVAVEAPYEVNEMIYVSCILMWHIATCYCELVLQRHGHGHGHLVDNKDHHVATDLSKYCAYLVASAPRLLPGRSETTKSVYSQVKEAAAINRTSGKKPSSAATAGDKLEAMDSCDTDGIITFGEFQHVGDCIYKLGVKLGKGLTKGMAPSDRWKLLAEFWVKALVYAAPSDNVEEHMQRLSQGGELITHLWAMLYHAGIHRWQLNPPTQDNNFKMGWDYIFRIRSWKDLEHHKGNNKQLVNEGHPSEVWFDNASNGARQDGASSSRPPPPP